MDKTFQLLVVDDDNDMRAAVVRMFEKRKFQVYQANSGKEAFEIVKRHPIDLVLSDVRMPNGTGVELLGWIRARHPDTPIVVLATGYSDLKEDLLKIGATAMVGKPFDRKELLDMVDALLGLAKKNSKAA